MSNMTKAIAVLGVVAGLGVAALPLSTYAAETIWAPEYPEGAEHTEANKNANWGVTMGEDENGNRYVKTDATAISLEILDTLSISSDNQAVALKPQAGATTVAGLYTGDASVNLNVKTNNSKGYTLVMTGAGTTGHETELWSGTDAIVAGDLTGAVSEWGYYLGDGVESGTQTWTKLETNGNSLLDAAKNEGEKATPEAGDDYKVSFGANIVDGQAAGTYEGKVVFTATNRANN